MSNEQQRAQFTSTLPDVHPPFKEAWRIVLPSESFIWATPQIQADVVAVRCGRLMACVNILDGGLQWQVEVGTEDIENEICVSSKESDALITASSNDGESTLFFLSWADGRELWQAHLPGRVMDHGVTVNEQRVYIFSAEENKLAYHIREFDVQNGKLLRMFSAPSGANYALVMNRLMFFCSQSIWKEDAGLYVLQLETKKTQKLLDASVNQLQRGQKTVVALIERSGKQDYEAIALSPTKLTKLWSADHIGIALAANAGEIAHLEIEDQGKKRVVLREEETSTVLWKSDPLMHQELYIFFSGNAVYIQDKKGITILNRVDGSLLGRLDSPEWSFSWGAAIAPGRLIVGHANEVICYVSSHQASK